MLCEQIERLLLCLISICGQRNVDKAINLGKIVKKSKKICIYGIFLLLLRPIL